MSSQSHAGSRSLAYPTLIDRLREIRKDAIRLNSSVVEHLKAFQQEDDSFNTLPPPISKSRSEDPTISVGSTCTALMALLATKTHKRLWSITAGAPEKSPVDIGTLFARLVQEKWESSGLPDGNAFTTALVVRTAGFVVKARIISPEAISLIKHKRYESKNEKGEPYTDEEVADKTLRQIIESKAGVKKDSTGRKRQPFSVSGYPSKTSIAYWFVDGAVSAEVDLGDSLEEVAGWATKQFHQQLIYVSAGNDSLMDPPELAMAACLINRIHRLCAAKPDKADLGRSLPSQVELLFAVKRVLAEQPESGIWHKYFPLFHFPRGGGAADYCFSFEFLEAILAEFGHRVLETTELLDHFKRSLAWCDNHFLHYVFGEKHYRGWNSGGEVTTLASGMPECWATAAVHMFLNQLHLRVSEILDELVLKEEFGIDRLAVVRSREELAKLIDVDIQFPGEAQTSLVKVIRNELLYNAQKARKENPFKLGVPRSALLFGPPGTSKTSLAKAIAKHLGWPIVTVNPSKFLGAGLEQVHAQVDNVFRGLMDLRKSVVFFDEMDALAQTREGAPEEADTNSLDLTRLLLTTSMLPKLADLWDRAGVIFLMATNHRRNLDPAITRAGRFDLLLCVAPPSWPEKRKSDKIGPILGISNATEVTEKLENLVPNGSSTEWLLDLFTVTELGIFFDYLRRVNGTASLIAALSNYKSASAFSEVVAEWAKNGMALRNKYSKREYNEDIKASRRQYYPKEGAGKILAATSPIQKTNKDKKRSRSIKQRKSGLRKRQK